MPGRRRRIAGQYDPLVRTAIARAAGAASGSVDSVSAAPPLVSTGGANPIIGLQANRTVIAMAANAAALASLPLTGLGVGTLAYVGTYGAYFALRPVAPLIADVILASSNVGFVWERAFTAIAAQAAAQTTWLIDSVDGNNENDGLTPSTALKTKSELARRWGSWSPTIDATVTITYASPDTTGDDPGFFAPNFVNGGSLRHTASPLSTFSGTLNVVTAKSQAGNQGLVSTFTVTTGAVSSGVLLVNATRGNSAAFAVRDTGGGAWLLTQPMAPYTPNTFPSPTENNAWANGDAITGFVLPSIDIARVGGRCAAYNAAFAPAHIVDHLTIVDAGVDSGAGTIAIDPGACVIAWQTSFVRNVSVSGSGTAVIASTFLNCDFQSQCNVVGTATTNVLAGSLRAGGILVNATLGNDVVVQQSLVCAGVTFSSSAVYVDSASSFQIDGNFDASGAVAFYGAGTLNVKGLLRFTAATAGAALPIATLQLNGVATGYSNATSTGTVTVHGGIALSAANLDAAAGAAGFGGYAFGGGATISRSGLQP
ncbi:MAG: hypothetical protein ACREU5_06880 [Burkholderiales bacterium]